MNPLAHRLTGLHDLFLYVALMLGFFAVITGAHAPLWLIVGFPAGLVAAHLFCRTDLAERTHNGWWAGLVFAAAILTAVRYLLNPALDVIVLGAHFALILTVIRLFSRRGPRDELQVYALSFLTMAAASEINAQLIYGVLFGMYVLTGTFGLALFHLKTEADDQPTRDPSRPSPFDRTYIGVLAGISILIFAGSLLIFFAFPRIGLGFFADPARNGISVAGFDDQVDVGDHGSVRDNPSVVMRVEFDDRPPGYRSILWRARTFDTFDGNSWGQSKDDSRESAPHSVSRNYDLGFLHSETLNDSFDGPPEFRAEIQLEPLGIDVIPTVWPTDHIRLGEADSSRIARSTNPTLDFDAYGDLYHSLPDDAGLTYELTVQPSPDDNALLAADGTELDDEDTETYLDLPDTDPRLAELADELTADADTDYERAQQVVDHFHSEFSYTLDLPEIDDDPVAEFLFDHREGHCEYFATAAVLLLREAGVPARLVNGFLGGTWNDVGDYLAVRHGDAHAWAEVYVPDYGWVPVDPTPPIESTFLERAGITQLVSDTIDAMRHTWNSWFISYDFDRQIGLLRDIGQTLAPETPDDTDAADDDDEPPLPFRSLIFWSGWLALLMVTWIRCHSHPAPRSRRHLAALVALTIIAAGWTGWFQGWTPQWTVTGAASVIVAAAIPTLLRARQTPEDLRAATRLFRTIEQRADRSGFPRRPDEGPGEFLDRIGDKLSNPTALKHFRRLYLDVRFGQRELDEPQRRRLNEAAARIVRNLKKL